MIQENPAAVAESLKTQNRFKSTENRLMSKSQNNFNHSNSKPKTDDKIDFKIKS